jgi:hypothetical protein
MCKKLILAVLAAAMIFSMTACVVELENLGGMVSGAVKEYKESVEFSDSFESDEPIKIGLDLKAAKAIFDSTDEKIVDSRFLYSSRESKPEFLVRNNKIKIRSGDIRTNSNSINQWEVKLTEKLPLEIEMKADGADLKLNLGKTLLKELDMSLNASSAKLYFDDQNNETMEKFKLNADASNVSIYSAGNCSFEKLYLEAKASKVSADLTGEYKQDGRVSIEADASTIRLKLPDEVGVRIVMDRYHFSTVNIKNDRILSRSEKEYVTKDYDKAGLKLDIYADLNVTTMTIE